MTEQEFKTNKRKEQLKAVNGMLRAMAETIKVSHIPFAAIPHIAQAAYLESRLKMLAKSTFEKYQRQQSLRKSGEIVSPLKDNPFTKEDIKEIFKGVEGVELV